MSEKYPDLQYTDFPEQLDKQMDIKDPTATILPLIKTYNTLIANGNFVEAIQLLSENPELRASQMNAEKLLRIHHSILSLQRFFYDNVLDKIYQIGQQKGDWNAYMSSTASGDNKLNMYDIVKYPVDGIYQYFMVISSEINAGDIPTEHPDKYMQMTIKGDKGDSGIGMSPCGEWDSGKSYQPYDLVSYQEWFWYCTESNSGNEPSDDSTVWTKFKITYPSSVKRYSYSLTANVDNQTRFAVPMETFDYKRDVVFVQSGITSLFQGQDFEVVSDGILLTEGVPLGRTIGIYVLKNVEDTTIEPETVTGALIEDGSIPLKKLAELPTPEQIGAVLVNPNLLDNWYFGNPVNQRNGYYALAGVTYYSDTALTTAAGTLQANTNITYVNTTYGKFISSGTDYYVAYADMVKGYVGTGYTIDRWRLGGYTNITTLIENEGLKMEYGSNVSGSYLLEYFFEKELIENLRGRRVTLSALCRKTMSNNSYIRVNFQEDAENININIPQGEEYELVSGTCTVPEEVWDTPCISFVTTGQYSAGDAVYIKAIKMELGEQQTLAHQDDNGNWVLNEIPNYGEQLTRCKRFYRVCRGGLVGVCLGGFSYFYLQQDVPMRTAPSVSVITLGTVRCAGKSLPIMHFLLGGVLDNVIIFTAVHESNFDLADNACFLPHQTSFALEADL